ncbi:MAG: SEC-C domain-containing protein, partial [Rhodospirillales bacterium]|nr:SEC-C domain-containing protein [Rhodospirillales bacterium]
SRRPDPPDPASALAQNGTNEPNSAAPHTPRNAPCPCGSGQKYTRCCGRNAPGGLLAFLK